MNSILLQQSGTSHIPFSYFYQPRLKNKLVPYSKIIESARNIYRRSFFHAFVTLLDAPVD